MQTRNIAIDTETNWLIESQRENFEETANDILKRCLRKMSPAGLERATAPQPEESETVMAPKLKKSRKTGIYRIELPGKVIEETSLRGAYIACLRALQARDASFFPRLSQEETAARRIVADTPEKLFKKTPELAASFAERLDNRWYLDTNLSESQVIQRLKIAAKIASLEFDHDLRVDFG